MMVDTNKDISFFVSTNMGVNTKATPQEHDVPERVYLGLVKERCHKAAPGYVISRAP